MTKITPDDRTAVRPALDADIDHLAKLWHDVWHESHAALVPADLARRRTEDSFRDRLRKAVPRMRVVGPVGRPDGFCIIKERELYQLFVGEDVRGSGIAAALIDDAEARLRDSGVAVAWLACAIGNERAARFYEKRGWGRSGTIMDPLETSEGTFLLEVWRYEKTVGPSEPA